MATDLGKVGIVMKGTWNNSTTYEVLDAVSYNSCLYIALQNVPAGTLPTNTTYWQLALGPVVTEYGTTGITLEYSSAGATNPTYNFYSSSAVTQIGNLVAVSLSINLTAVGSGSSLVLKGLPVLSHQPRIAVQIGGAGLTNATAYFNKSTGEVVFTKNTNGTPAVGSADLTTNFILLYAVYLCD